MGEWGHEPETLELASAGLGTSGRVGSSKRQGARDDSGAGFEDTWSSHSIRMTVGCLVAPRPPLPHDPWLLRGPGGKGRLWQWPQGVFSPLSLARQLQQPVDDRGLQGVRPRRAQPWEQGAHHPGAAPVSALGRRTGATAGRGAASASGRRPAERGRVGRQHQLGLKIQDVIHPQVVGTSGSLSRAVPTGVPFLPTPAPSLFSIPGVWWWWPTRPRNSTRRPTGPATTYRTSPVSALALAQLSFLAGVLPQATLDTHGAKKPTHSLPRQESPGHLGVQLWAEVSIRVASWSAPTAGHRVARLRS